MSADAEALALFPSALDLAIATDLDSLTWSEAEIADALVPEYGANHYTERAAAVISRGLSRSDRAALASHVVATSRDGGTIALARMLAGACS